MAFEEREAETGARPKIFDCKMCGDCCRGYGGTVVSQVDIERIAAYIGENPDRFLADYCQMSGAKPVLAQGKKGYCVFWDGSCRIYPVKPRMCRQWPYIRQVLVDIGNWDIMAASCPGMRTDVPPRVIFECVERELGRPGGNPG